MDDKVIKWDVEGMNCAGCAGNITQFLKKQGLRDVYVNFSTGEVRFTIPEGTKISLEKIRKGIDGLGYRVVSADDAEPFWTLERKLIFSAVFTLPLLFQHFAMMWGGSLPFLDNPYVQLLVCLPVFVLGFFHFGGSAWAALKNGSTHMDILIFIGSTAAFVYSLIGTFSGEMNYIFYETSATIITLVLFGNWLEHRSVRQTTTAIEDLSRLQVEKALKVMPSGTMVSVGVEDLMPGDVLQVNEGDKIPADGQVLEGQISVDESMLTGESVPVEKSKGDTVIGGSVVLRGNMRMVTQKVGDQTVLSQMIELVKTAQMDKPDIQRLADRITAIFVPAVLTISVLTLLISWLWVGIPFQNALMNAIAVLVISCPCAMGLATPTAVMVGVGKLAKNGILVKGAKTLETFAQIKNMVFDKTGTLTSGQFKIKNIHYQIENKALVHSVLYKLEQRSSHPIARSIVRELESGDEWAQNGTTLRLSRLEEVRGKGILATDDAGNVFKVGTADFAVPGHPNGQHNLYLSQNDQLIAAVDIADELKPDARQTIRFLKENGFKTILLSGDKAEKVETLARELGIDEVYAEKLPAEKLQIIETLSKEAPTAMVGDGINDAPALAKATIGVSLSDASQVAIQSAQIVLLDGKLDRLVRAVRISRATLQTIRQNLFWAFAYNIVAIPIAAMGFLNPMWGALFMAFSDLVVVGNSIRLKMRKVTD
ncbi:MAG: cadmium-translocating P-type ATPase [Bacteroidetes bacterium]|nr:MAG: cadmium-translocating P-type ATPase [Bacteroidota bacterium]